MAKRKYKISDHQRSGKPGGPGSFYIKKTAAYSKDWVGEWESVQRRRINGDPLMLGGQHKNRFDSTLGALFTK